MIAIGFELRILEATEPIAVHVRIDDADLIDELLPSDHGTGNIGSARPVSSLQFGASAARIERIAAARAAVATGSCGSLGTGHNGSMRAVREKFSGSIAASRDHRAHSIRSTPPRYGRSGAGIAIEPSACWCISRSGIRIRGLATTVLFNE